MVTPDPADYLPLETLEEAEELVQALEGLGHLRNVLRGSRNGVDTTDGRQAK